VNRSNGHRWQGSPASIGFENDLYWPDDLQDGQDPEVYERQFSEFESKALPVIKRLLESGAMPTDEEELGILYNFIAFQFVRTPDARRTVAGPRVQTARIIIDLLENNRNLYEGEMRRLGGNLDEFTFERFQQAKGSYEVKLTTEGFLEGAMAMMDGVLNYVHRRKWTVLVSERPGESFVVSDHPVVLEWSEPRDRRFAPGHAHIETELTLPLSAHVALIGCYTPFELNWRRMAFYVSGVNSRTIDRARVFVAARESEFILQSNGAIISSAEFIEQLVVDAGGRHRPAP